MLKAELATKFACDTCIEIRDVEKFALRLRTALRPNPRVKLRTLRQGSVKYYETENPPEAVWALPDEIILHKRVTYAHEEEYRFAFSLKADAFDFENVNLQLTTGPTARIPMGTYPQMLVKLGSIQDFCRVHRF